MKKNQSGFSIVEVIAVAAIIGILGTVGWLVVKRQKNPNLINSNNTLNSTNKSPSTIQYSVTEAIETIKSELAKENKQNLTNEDVRIILGTEFEWQDKYSGESNDKTEFIKAYPFPIDYMKAKLTKNSSTSTQRVFTEEDVTAVYRAEEAYLIKIGAIDPTASDQQVKTYTRVN